MSFENKLLISRKATKELREVPEKERELIKDRISKLAFFPLARLDVQKLRGYENIYRLRVGEYRIIFEYQKRERLIKVLKIGKRENVY
ncbi:type II toxin-antitoxin system RelE family toxin [Thermococcus gammatolerans]|uniref:Plasmid stabilization system addiction module toxin, RelE/StbE family n=1 Tax=Thermococcus gammatolerans (strain DSM 15229 / JCM 11827 / EJ3) TaxID=593117 RepID=C5A6N9_THEGJ|nr:type II toxin-antitoxin system RelE/ParE family toxin [Thermococcus gammatolerans]ACS33901.1 Plasmid stabilization system addiction module toxin, RelE/StbE family [Thermococcus gammatolerans EJ3]